MKSNYIVEIQGLRTLAALLVAIYHIWFQKVSGGVDVFFVISAYFIAYSLTKLNFPTVKDLVGYYNRTFRRVLPSASAVFIFSSILFAVYVPYVYFNSEIKHSIATIFFTENWYLAASKSSYLSDEGFKSIFQQFWALAVQVQFYVIFPIIFYLMSRFFKTVALTKKINWFFSFLAILSFSYALIVTSLVPDWAYFDSMARAWEFIAGILLFNNIEKISLNSKLATFLNIIAILAIATFGVVVPQGASMPGFVTLIPVVSACTILVCSRNDLLISPLSSNVLSKFGDYSFAFYLFHWPIYIVIFNYNAIFDNSHLNGLFVIISSFALAFLTTKYIETPIRKSSSLSSNNMRAFALVGILVCMQVSIACIFVFNYFQIKNKEIVKLERFYSGEGDSTEQFDPFFPHPLTVKLDLPETYESGCHQRKYATSVNQCSFGDTNSERLIVLVGGSHATQWLPPLKTIAKRNNFHLIALTKSDCSFTDDVSDSNYLPSEECLVWNKNVVQVLKGLEPQYLVTTVTRPGVAGEYIPQGYIKAWDNLKIILPKTKIIGLRDNPWFQFDPALCNELQRSSYKGCSKDYGSFYKKEVEEKVKSSQVNIFIDFSTDFCPNGSCTTVTHDKVLKYRDRHHLSKVYTLTFVNTLETKLYEAQVISKSAVGIGKDKS